MDSLDGMKVDPSDTIFNGLKIIESGKEKIAFVIDVNSVLVGTLSDGDIRRALLRGVSLDQAVGEVCNRNFISSRTRSFTGLDNDSRSTSGSILQRPPTLILGK